MMRFFVITIFSFLSSLGHQIVSALETKDFDLAKKVVIDRVEFYDLTTKDSLNQLNQILLKRNMSYSIIYSGEMPVNKVLSIDRKDISLYEFCLLIAQAFDANVIFEPGRILFVGPDKIKPHFGFGN